MIDVDAAAVTSIAFLFKVYVSGRCRPVFFIPSFLLLYAACVCL
jgi:hypothetical protein